MTKKTLSYRIIFMIKTNSLKLIKIYFKRLILKIRNKNLKTSNRKKGICFVILGCGRKTKDINMEKNLIKWINL